MSDETSRRDDQLISGYLDGGLSPADDRELAARLQADSRLRAQLQNFLQLDDLVDQTLHSERNIDNFIAGLRLRQNMSQNESRPRLQPRRRLGQRRRQRQSGRGYAVGIALAVAVILAAIWVGRGSVTSNQGNQAVADAPVPVAGDAAQPVAVVSVATWHPESAEAFTIESGQTVVGPGRIAFSDGSVLQLSGSTQAIPRMGPGGATCELVVGSIVAQIQPQIQGQVFRINSGHGIVHVLGTQFYVQADDNETRVGVAEGRVRFSDIENSESIELVAGQVAVSRLKPSRLKAESGLVGYWRLDQGGALPDAIIHGATWSEGQERMRLVFDGVDDYVEIPLSDALDGVTDGDYTVMARYRPIPAVLGHDLTLETSGVIVGRSGWTVGLYHRDDLRLMMQDFSEEHPHSRHANSKTPHTDIRDYHVAGVVRRDLGTTSLYIDGQLDVEASYRLDVSPFPFEESTWKIGMGKPDAGNDEFARPLRGVVADVRIYNRALRSEEIAAMAALDALSGSLAP